MTSVPQVPQVKIHIINPLPRLRIGCHVSKRKTLHDTLSFYGQSMTCMQFFLQGNAGYKCSNYTEDDRRQTLNYCLEHKRTFYLLLPYHLNVARLDTDLVFEKTINAIQLQVDQFRGLPAAGVLHAGKSCHGGGIELISKRLNTLNLEMNSHIKFPLLIENSAGQGSDYGWCYNDLRRIFEGIDNATIGLCIDTQHAFAAGMCDFGSIDTIDKMFEEIESFHPAGISLFHLNDSDRIFGSRVDRHESIGKGFIWKDDETPLQYLLSRAEERETDIILETPNPLINLDYVRQKFMFK